MKALLRLGLPVKTFIPEGWTAPIGCAPDSARRLNPSFVLARRADVAPNRPPLFQQPGEFDAEAVFKACWCR